MHKDWSAKTKNAISMDATRTISKWLNEPTDAPLDRVALATVLARVGFLENELQGLKNVFDAMLGRTAGIVELMQTAQYELRQANIVGNHALNNMPTHYSSEPYEKLGADNECPSDDEELEKWKDENL